METGLYKPVSRPMIIVVLAVALLVLVAVPLRQHFTQQSNVAAAREYVEKIRPLLGQNPHFANVKLGPYTGHGGCLRIDGSVASEEELRDLQHVIASVKIDIPIEWEVDVEKSK